MQFKWLNNIVCLSLALFITGNVWAADKTKIGIVDVQRVLEVSKAGKDGLEEIKTQKEEMEKDLTTKRDEIQKLGERLEREAMVMSKEMREEKEREGRIKVNDLKNLEKKYRQELQKTNSRIMKDILKDINDIIENIGKKGDYLLIIGKREAGVAYAPKSIDLTDEVIKKYDQQYKKK